MILTTNGLMMFLFLLNNYFRQINSQYCYGCKRHATNSLTGDVQNWALLIQSYILKLASDSMHREKTQSYFDSADYKEENKSGDKLLHDMKLILDTFFEKKQRAANAIADEARQIYDKLYMQRYNDYKLNSTGWYISEGMSPIDSLLSTTITSTASINKKEIYPLGLSKYQRLLDLNNYTYRDADIPLRFPPNMTFHPHFKRNVSLHHSVVKISDEIPRDDIQIIWTVEWTYELEKIFRENRKLDPEIRWQYFGSNVGLIRLYPGREWDQNFAGFYNDYDPRIRPWYIGTTSGPKDIIIILDCSRSMRGSKFEIGKSIAKVIIDTLTKQDYVNIICVHESHWNDIGKWTEYKTEVLSCQQDTMVQATLAYKRDLKEKLLHLHAGGTSEFENAFDLTFDLFQRKPKTGCHTLIIFITDGQDTDGETVRCGAGQYTRSGYVPGPICKYNWTKYWNTVKHKQQFTEPKARIFSYLIQDNGQVFPGRLACDNNGHFQMLADGENLINKMYHYFDYLSKISLDANGSWTSQYIDQWGLGVMITYAIPVVSTIDNTTIGVAGVDITLDDIENVLMSKTWGTVYGFLINRDGDAIIHPGLKSTTIPIEDPISTHVTKLEMIDNKPENFSYIVQSMLRGEMGSQRLPNAYRSTIRRQLGILGEHDEKFREVRQPKNLLLYDESFFNLLIEYNSTKGRENLKGKFEHMQVKINDTKYQNLRVSYLYSSIMLAPRVYCDPSEYFYNDDLAQKTIDAHIYINYHLYNNQTNNNNNNITVDDIGCRQNNSKFHENTRAYVLISQPIERVWRQRPPELTKDIIWTYVGMRTGVFRTYPAHRSVREYDHTTRAWYKRAVAYQDRTTASMPYLDLSGGGKVITIAQAIFE
ncbi:unnamed protein product, partial [Didymodactylos carnosus]